MPAGTGGRLNNGFAYRAEVAPDAAGRRLDGWLAATYRHSTADDWAARLSRREITIDGVVARGDDILRAGDVVVWQRPPWPEPDVPLTFDVIHEDEDLVVVSKPGGLPTMPAGGFLLHTLLTLVRGRFGDAFPAHRLGRGTSGLVLFARTREVAATVAAAWRGDAVTKNYRALASGDPAWHTREITTPIGPVPHAALGTLYAASAAGRPARSLVTVRERRDGAVLCDVGITTGRPHQIRIHLAAAGHPLVGDPLYTVGGVPHDGTCVRPGEGGYLLHAHTLRLPHPRHGGPLHLVAPPPAALRAGTDRRG